MPVYEILKAKNVNKLTLEALKDKLCLKDEEELE